MAFSVTVGAVNQTSKLLLGSLTMRYNSFDFTLKSPATVPALGDTVTVVTPTWSGTVVSVANSEPPRKQAARLVHITATNADVPGASAGPWALSDAPSPTSSYGYRDLTYTLSRTPSGDTTQAHLTCFQSGLWPAMTVALTSANYGLTAANFTVSEVTITWLSLTHQEYQIDLGDPLVTLSVWAASDTGGILPITRTKITDGEVITPKLATNAVTSDKIDAGAVTADKLSIGTAGMAPLTNPGFELGNMTGWTTSGSVAARVTAGGDALKPTGTYLCSINGVGYITSQTLVAATPGEYVHLSAAVGWNGGSLPSCDFVVLYFDSAQAYISYLDSSFSVTAAATYDRSFGPAPAGTAYVEVQIKNGTAGVQVLIDDIVLSRATSLVTGDGSVVMDYNGITIINGKLTLTSAGSTIIIDGTSDMFKIAATGTTAVAGPAAGGFTEVDIVLSTGFTYRPMLIGMTDRGTSVADPLGRISYNTANGLVAYQEWLEASVVSTNQTNVACMWNAVGNYTGQTHNFRYYVLAEVAI
jgi:hypothetical protein